MADDAGGGFFRKQSAAAQVAPVAREIRRLLTDLQERVERSAFRGPEDLAALAGALEHLALKVADDRDLTRSVERSLSASIEALARRVDGQAMTQARLAAQLADIEARMDQKFDALLDEMTALRVTPASVSPQPRGPMMALVAAALAAGLGVLAAVGLFLAQAEPQADLPEQAQSAQQQPSL